MIYTVTFNPSLDYIVNVDGFQAGEINRTTSEIMLPGGKGINVSIVLKNLGIESAALGFMAGFTGREIAHRVDEFGVGADFISVAEGISRINLKIRSDEETAVNGIGPKITNEDIHKLYEKLNKLTNDDVLVLAGSIPTMLPESIYMDIMKHVELLGPKVVVDATKDLLVNVLPYKPFLIKPNNEELGEIFGVELSDKDSVAEYACKLQSKGARNVLVSMAGDGAVLIAEDGKEYRAEAPKGKLVNSVGAGDSMVAGFIAGYMKNNDYFEAFKQGVCTGSASAFSENLATREEVELLMKKSESLFSLA